MIKVISLVFGVFLAFSYSNSSCQQNFFYIYIQFFILNQNTDINKLNYQENQPIQECSEFQQDFNLNIPQNFFINQTAINKIIKFLHQINQIQKIKVLICADKRILWKFIQYIAQNLSNLLFLLQLFQLIFFYLYKIIFRIKIDFFNLKYIEIFKKQYFLNLEFFSNFYNNPSTTFNNTSLLAQDESYLKYFETIFVVDLIRHGARSHYLPHTHIPQDFFDNAKQGHLTRRGRIDSVRLGQARRKEYVKDKKFLDEKYNPKQILQIATFKERCVETAFNYLNGLYPLEDFNNINQNILQHLQDRNSPLIGTILSKTLSQQMENEKVCYKTPIFQIQKPYEQHFHTCNCKTLNQYLNQDKYNVTMLQDMFDTQFGATNLTLYKIHLEQHFGIKINSLREYGDYIDSYSAELYQSESEQLRAFQRQETFYVANNFLGEDKIHQKIFDSRQLLPVYQTLLNAQQNTQNGLEFDLKLLQITFHTTNLSNLLRFLGYFETHGYENYVRFSSNLRFELLRDSNFANNLHENNSHQNQSEFYVRVVYDNQDVQLPYCKEKYCKLEEFMGYVKEKLTLDEQVIDDYCDNK